MAEAPNNNTMSDDWAYFGHFSALPPHFDEPPAAASWAIDEFLHFATARRSHLRRSACETADFLDDEQLMSVFSDETAEEVAPLPSSHAIPASPSGHDEGAAAADQPAVTEEQNASKAEEPPAAGRITDPKRMRRIQANRQSAQRSRVRKLQYVAELERSVAALQTELAALSPRVAFLDHQRSTLSLGNCHLKQRLAALAQDIIFKDAHQAALKKEMKRLTQLYHQQNMAKLATSNPQVAPPPKELFDYTQTEHGAYLCSQSTSSYPAKSS